MFKNYIKIAWRSLKKNRLQTIINLLGLTVGTLSCLIILLYIFAQTGYDIHHDRPEDLYRVETDIIRDGQVAFNTAAGAAPIAPALRAELPEVENYARVVSTDVFNTNMIRSTDSKEGYYEPRAYLADATFFDLFTYTFIEGSANNALTEPNTTVLSSGIARKLFGNQPALNKTVAWGTGEDAQTLKVTGVFDENAHKSHLNPNYIVSMTTPGMGTFVNTFENYATNNFIYSYVKLAPNVSAKDVQEKLPAFLEKNGGKDLANAGMDGKILNLEKVSDIYLKGAGKDNQIDKVFNINYLYFLLMLAVFIQLVACINFVNLSTARASKRGREIGIRKVVGAGKASLIKQFLGESILLSVIAILISIPVAILLLPYVNELTDSSLDFKSLLDWKIGALIIALGLVTGILSGIYPAIILSSVKPLKVLKANSPLKSSGGFLRKGLVVFQFVISISLIVVVMIVVQQLRFTQAKDLGYEKDNLIALRAGSSDVATQYTNLKTSLINIPGVQDVAAANYSPSENILSDNGLYLPGGDPQELTLVKRNGVSHDYMKTMNIEILQGRDFSESATVPEIIVNRTTLKKFNIPEENALSTILLQSRGEDTYEYHIIGVVDDYHFSTLKDEIQPLFLYRDLEPNWIFVKVNTDDYQQVLSSLETEWKKVVSSAPFSYNFVDKEVELLYKEEQRLGSISIIFTVLAIFISCLGLFGLVSFMAEQKRKEIGIRKVLGASVNSVVQLLTKDFLILIVIALTIATPIAYYFMNEWLQNYTYHIDINWWTFVVAGGGAIAITLFTVSFQAIKAAIANPVNSLRSE